MEFWKIAVTYLQVILTPMESSIYLLNWRTGNIHIWLHYSPVFQHSVTTTALGMRLDSMVGNLRLVFFSSHLPVAVPILQILNSTWNYCDNS